MSNKPKVSKAIIRRLPKYRRYLGQLMKQKIKKISSNELSEIIGYTASQIRQDFNTFGEFGQQGYGYSVEYLYNEINKILGLGYSGHNVEYKTVVVGVGHLGQAITNHTYYNKIGFNIIGLFDINDEVIGKKINDVEVRHFNDLKEFCRNEGVDIGIICVTSDAAQNVADTLVAGGVKGIWNFAPVDLDIPETVALESVHLSDSLHALSFMIKNMNDAKEKEKE